MVERPDGYDEEFIQFWYEQIDSNNMGQIRRRHQERNLVSELGIRDNIRSRVFWGCEFVNKQESFLVDAWDLRQVHYTFDSLKDMYGWAKAFDPGAVQTWPVVLIFTPDMPGE